MTELTDDALKALLDGATPGPWRADGEPWNRVVWSSADNRVCFMAHSNGLNDERDIATSNLAAAAPDLARALIDARAERDRLRADAQAAVALVLERAADAFAAHPAIEAKRYADTLCQWRWRVYETIRAFADADALGAVEALRGEARESAMQALASMGQAQEAYEAQLKAEAELAAVQQREAGLLGLIRWAHETLWELNPNNYDHDEVCKVNDAAVEVILGLAPVIGETHGYSAEWWAERAALSNNGRGE